MCLIYEAMEAVTTSLMMTSAIAYSAELSSTTTLATVQGLIGGTYYGIGKCCFFLLVIGYTLHPFFFPILRPRRRQLCWRISHEIVRYQDDIPHFGRGCRLCRAVLLLVQHFLHPTTPFGGREIGEKDATGD